MLGQYTTVPNIIFSDNRLQRSCIIVFGVLQSHAGIDGRIYPSYDTIAQEGGISRRTAIRAVKQLEFFGYIAVEKGTFKGSNKQASNYYYLNPNPAVFSIKKNVDKSASYPHTSDTDVTPRGCQNVTPNNNRNEYKKNACIDNNINNTIRTRESEPERGGCTCEPSLCENNEKILGHSGTKKLKSPFDAFAGANSKVIYMQEKKQRMNLGNS